MMAMMPKAYLWLILLDHKVYIFGMFSIIFTSILTIKRSIFHATANAHAEIKKKKHWKLRKGPPSLQQSPCHRASSANDGIHTLARNHQLNYSTAVREFHQANPYVVTTSINTAIELRYYIAARATPSSFSPPCTPRITSRLYDQDQLFRGQPQL